NALAGYFHVPLISCNTFEYLRMRLPVERKKDTAVILKGGGDHVALALPGSKKIHRMSVEELEPFLKRKKTVKYGTGEKSLMIKGMKQVANKKMRSLGEVVLELPKKAPSKKLVKPYYLNPPHITKSKKEVFA
ncbi:MAG TPA: hypothetical protein VI588_04410, partial [Candidatus Gracilibacteria bacterium]|nr:hypothetical protein [Candidatus Gracilibacteria bacterium]